MKISFKPLEGAAIPCYLPYEGADYVVPAHPITCPAPGCGTVITNQFQGGEMTHDHDTYYAVVRCSGCGGRLGQLRAEVSTIFGIEEDARVLGGRCRVY